MTDPKQVSVNPSIRRPSDVHSHTLPDGRLSVECWCRRSIHYVAPEVVQERRTVSCGRPACQPGLIPMIARTGVSRPGPFRVGGTRGPSDRPHPSHPGHP